MSNFFYSANGFLTPHNLQVPLHNSEVSMQSIGTILEKRGKESWLGLAGDTRTSPCVVTLNSAPRKTLKPPVYLRREKGLVVENVTICLDGGPLGLAIYGGSDINCQPFSSDEPGIFISHVSFKSQVSYNKSPYLYIGIYKTNKFTAAFPVVCAPRHMAFFYSAVFVVDCCARFVE